MNLKMIRQIGVVATLGMVTTALTAAAATASPGPAAITAASMHTTTPIKHVVIIIGENHSFDNVFATYKPPGHQHIWNLLSKGIVTRGGSPGPDFAKASQLTATNTSTGHRLCRVVPERVRRRDPAPGRRDREPEPEARDQQQLHPGRLRQQHHGEQRSLTTASQVATTC